MDGITVTGDEYSFNQIFLLIAKRVELQNKNYLQLGVQICFYPNEYKKTQILEE